MLKLGIVFLYAQALACTPPSASDSVYVDALAENSGAQGSPCAPFPTLQQALTAAANIGSSQVTIVKVSENEVYQTNEVSLERSLSVELNSHTWEFAGDLIVTNVSQIIVQNGQMMPAKTDWISIKIAEFSRLKLINIRLSNWVSPIFFISGTLLCDQCQFSDNTKGVAQIEESGGSLHIWRSQGWNNTAEMGTLIRVSALDTNARLQIEITESEFRDSSASFGGSVVFISSKTIAGINHRNVTITHSNFTRNSGIAILLVAQSVDFHFNNCRIVESEHALILSMYESNLFIENSQIFDSTQSPITVLYLNGTISFSAVNITGVAVGPAFMLVNSFPDMTKAVIELKDVKIFNVNSTVPTSPGGGIFANGFTLKLWRVEMAYMNCFVSCGFIFAFNQLAIDHLYIHDIVAWFFMFGQAIGCIGDMRNIEMSNAVSLGLLSFVQAFCQLTISDLLMHDLTPNLKDERRQLYNLVPTHQFFSQVEFSRVLLILPPQRSVVMLWCLGSDIMFRDLAIPHFAATQGVTVIMSRMRIEGFTVGSGEMETFFEMIGAVVNVTGFSVHGGVISSAIFTAQQATQLVCSNLDFRNLRAGSVIQTSFSTVHITNLIISSCIIDRLADNVLQTYSLYRILIIANAYASDSTLNFGLFLSSDVFVYNSTFMRTVSPWKWIKTQNSTIRFSNFSIQELTCDSEPGLVYGKSSEFNWTGGTVQNLWTLEKTFVSLTSSTLWVSDLTLDGFNGTFLSVTKGPIEIIRSTFINGGQHLRDSSNIVKLSGAVVECIRCTQVTLSNVHSVFVTGHSGGVVYAKFETPTLLTVKQSKFEHCKSADKGGVIHSQQAIFLVSDSVFVGNEAHDGGALYLSCNASHFLCSSAISASSFFSNVAVSGGALRWREFRPSFTQVTFANNSAVYGPDEASQASRLGLIDAHTLLPIQHLNYQGSPGQQVPIPLLIGLIDCEGQLVSTDNSSYVNIKNNLHAEFLGSTRLMAVGGIANYSAFIIEATPGSTIDIEAFSDEISLESANFERVNSFRFTYKMRDCVAGEHEENRTCFPCPKTSYSLQPHQECTACPSSATCPGGALMHLNTGYWRSSNTSDRIEKCFLEEACEGGLNSTCGRGFTSNLCGLCAPGWYQVGKFSCFECQSDALLFTRIVILGAFYLGFVTYAIYYSLKRIFSPNCSSGCYLGVLLRMMLTYLQSMMLISGLNTQWNESVQRTFEVMEFFGTLVIGSFSPECYTRNITTMPVVYLKLIIVSIGLLLMLAIIECIRLLLRIAKVQFNRELITTVEVVLILLMQPMQVKYAMSMLDCKHLDTGDWLVADMSERCWQGSHRLYLLTLALPSIALFGLGSLTLLAVFLFTQKTRSSVTTAYLMSGYSSERYYWEFICQAEKLSVAMTVGVLGSSDAKLQILATSMLVFSFLYTQKIYSPFLNAQVNRVCMYSITSIYAYVVLAFYNRYFLNSATFMRDALSTVSFGSLLLFMVVWIAAVVAAIREKRKVKPVSTTQFVDVSFNELAVPNNSALEKSVVL